MTRRATKALTATTALALVTTMAACTPGASVKPPAGSGSGPSKTASPKSGIQASSFTPGELSTNGADLSAYTSQTLNWSKANCTPDVQGLNSFSLRDFAAINARTTCAKVTVPKDYDNPSKGNITVLVTRTKAAKPSGTPRVLMTNPGGPGGPAGAFSVVTAALSPLGEQDDVIGVDPRGVGGSTQVPCAYYAADVKDSRNPSDADLKQMQQATKKTVDRCVAKYGDYLPYITTDNVARDHDLVRRLLKVDTVDYYGVSAGTWLGARYATLFPKQVGRFVLDSNTAFTSSFQTSFGMQPMAFQRRFEDQLLPWLARRDSTYGLGSSKEDVGKTYEAVRTAAGDGKLGRFYPDLIDNVVAQSLYTDRGFKTAGALIALLNDARNGDQRALRTAESALASQGRVTDDERSQNTVFMAVTCNDTPWSSDESSYATQGKKDGEKYPLVGWGGLTSPCAYWPYKTPQIKVDTTKAAPILMVQTEADPATAYEGAVQAHKASGNTRLLSVDDQGNHGAVLGAGNLCVEQQAYGFLSKGTLPGGDTVCPAIPLPADQQVYPIGTVPEGQKLPMPQDTTPGWKKALLAALQAILEKLLTPPSTPKQ
ncbi:alpha/beta hydrolase [Calidifontibacter sp. DB0510]|uniref:Alpha/beta hydrolase n=1 Tax=Metallococcus carri TaxID=1656884 RepID=A0A967EHW4_9MICO|nr:alpha/beta hydrolase [Metallococcus carri]NHN57258.1 alpha/beta hydrolase [Metallococcus carri]NOP37939.1 alpha/beta fold hydrolase [Calidifontibacter sp. DB2511S]